MRRIWLGSKQFALISLCGLLLLPLMAGCSPSQGKLSGRVLFNGAPLPGGMLLFRPADPKQNSVSTSIDENGNYQAQLPSGEVQVSVDNRGLKPPEPRPTGIPKGLPLPPDVRAKIEHAAKEAPKPSGGPTETVAGSARGPGKYVEIPRKYYDVSTSGLKFNVQGGDQKHDIELTK
jgi:hypothetical protein